MNSTASEPVITARGLRKAYRTTVALDNASFSIPSGRIVGLIGPNGAGKTTALKAILGLTSVEGDLSVLGRDPRLHRDELMNDICFIADVAVLPRWLKVREAIDFVAGVHPRFDRAPCERFLANTKLQPKQRVRELSKGMIVQLHLALVMAIDARILVLDEPTLGLDILYRKEFYQRLLEDYFDEQKTIIVTTHQVEEIEHILSDVMFIRDGRIVLDADMDDVGQRYTELLVNADQLETARALKPIDERSLAFGKTVMLFDGAPRTQLPLGEQPGPGRSVRRHHEGDLRMNAVNHPVSPMGTLRWLLKREYWENRGGFLYAPLIAGLISLVMSTIGIAFGLFALHRAARDGGLHIDGEDVNINGLDLPADPRHQCLADLATAST